MPNRVWMRVPAGFKRLCCPAGIFVSWYLHAWIENFRPLYRSGFNLCVCFCRDASVQSSAVRRCVWAAYSEMAFRPLCVLWCSLWRRGLWSPLIPVRLLWDSAPATAYVGSFRTRSRDHRNRVGYAVRWVGWSCGFYTRTRFRSSHLSVLGLEVFCLNHWRNIPITLVTEGLQVQSPR